MLKYPSATMDGYGYASPQYLSSLAEFGEPRRLPRSEGWVLVRPIEGTPHLDAMGAYPLFACASWSRIGEDLQEINDLVSLVLVTDPFGEYDASAIEACFNRGIRPFKQHHVTELGPPVETLASAHHRRNARSALATVEVDLVEEPSTELDNWVSLYDGLICRHRVEGIARFSRKSFAQLLRMPGLVMLRARSRSQTVGLILWLVAGDVAYYHLAAYSTEGYDSRASFALFWRSIEWFTGRVRWLDLGAGAGLADGAGGLDRFKKGWATTTRTVYLCRHVFLPEVYEQLEHQFKSQNSGYFPCYRDPSTRIKPDTEEPEWTCS